MTTRIFLLTLLSFLSLKAQTIIKACAPLFGKPDKPCNGQCPSCKTLMSNRNYPIGTVNPIDSWWKPALEFDAKNIVNWEVCEFCRCVFAVTMEKA